MRRPSFSTYLLLASLLVACGAPPHDVDAPLSWPAEPTATSAPEPTPTVAPTPRPTPEPTEEPEETDDPPRRTPTPPPDYDQDGYPAAVDCDDQDASVSPGAAEVPGNLEDEDCDGVLAGVYQVEQGSDAPEVYSSIQEAIDDAPEGAMVVVGAGTWSVTLDLRGKGISLLSRHGLEHTVLVADSDAPVLSQAHNPGLATVAGFTVSGGRAVRGGGLYLEEAHIVVESCAITSNRAADPFFECAALADPEGCVLETPAPSWGGGAYILGGEVSFRDVIFKENAAMYGGGLYAEGAALTVEGGVFEKNTGYMSKTVWQASAPGVSWTYFSSDWDALGAGEGGGLLIAAGTRARLSELTLKSNLSPIGAGLSHRGEWLELEGLTTYDNRANQLLQASGTYYDYCRMEVKGTWQGDGGGLNLEGDARVSQASFSSDRGIVGGALRVGAGEVEVEGASSVSAGLYGAEQVDDVYVSDEYYCCDWMGTCSGSNAAPDQARGGIAAVEGGHLVLRGLDASGARVGLGPALHSVGGLELRGSALHGTSAGTILFSDGELTLSGVSISGGGGEDPLLDVWGESYDVSHVSVVNTTATSGSTRPIFQLHSATPGCRIHSAAFSNNGGVLLGGEYPPDAVCYAFLYKTLLPEGEPPLEVEGLVTGEPHFLPSAQSSPDGVYRPVPGVGSPLVGKGDPALLDRNGSRGDIGATGGPDGVDPDADGDGVGDLWEATYGMGVGVKDGDIDPDGDHLRNVEEYDVATDPRCADTDGEGLSDLQELNAGTSPFNYFDPGPEPGEPGVAYVPEHLPSLEEAVAKIGEWGGHIKVQPGTYATTVILPARSFIIESTDGPEVTILTPGRAYLPIVTGRGVPEESIFQGFTLTGSRLDGASAVVIEAQTRGIWRDLHLRANSNSRSSSEWSCINGGGGMSVLDDAAPLLEDVLFADNVGACGGGLSIAAGGQAAVKGGEFSRNQADSGGGIYVGGELYLEDALIEGNSAAQGGGVLAADDLEIVRSTVRGNAASTGGGLAVDLYGSIAAADVLVTLNTATQGGGLYIDDYITVEVVGLHLVGNAATDGGGAFVLGADDGTELRELILEDNVASNFGGGVYFSNCEPTLRHARIIGNSAGLYGGGVYARCGSTLEQLHLEGNSAYAGGGFYLEGYRQPHQLSQISAVSNQATGGLGGGIYVQVAALELTNALLAYNLAIPGHENLYALDTVPTLSHNGWWVGGGGDGVSTTELDGTHTVAEPRFLPDDIRLMSSSPMLGVGLGINPDGSPAHIGAYGGAGADGWDLDGDGLPAWWDPSLGAGAEGTDCDDLDPEVGPCP